MNVKTLSIAAALFAGVAGFNGSAFAADEYQQNLNMPAQAASHSAPAARTQVAALDEYQQNLNQTTATRSTLLRAQVVAEAIEARKLGLLVGGEIGTLTPTPAQAEQIRLAGQHAVGAQYAAK